MKRKTINAALLCSICLMLFPACSSGETYTSGLLTVEGAGDKATASIFAMDTYMSMTVNGSNAFEAAKNAGELIMDYDSLFDVDGERSDVAAINSGAGGAVRVGEDVLRQINAAQEISQRSGGALDITVEPLAEAWGFTGGSEFRVPAGDEIAALLESVDYRAVEVSADSVRIAEGMKITLGAVAKGYTSDALMALFASSGIESAIVSLGGNVQVLGTKTDGTLWNVAIQDPERPEGYAGILSVSDTAVVTSGNYQRYFDQDGVRYGHILDPATGRPSNSGLLSVTVVSPSGLLSDCLSTALFVLGEEGALRYYETYGGFELVLITSDGRTVVTSGISGSFTPDPDSAYILEVWPQ